MEEKPFRERVQEVRNREGLARVVEARRRVAAVRARLDGMMTAREAIQQYTTLSETIRQFWATFDSNREANEIPVGELEHIRGLQERLVALSNVLEQHRQREKHRILVAAITSGAVINAVD